jgi:hypothetical protein
VAHPVHRRLVVNVGQYQVGGSQAPKIMEADRRLYVPQARLLDCGLPQTRRDQFVALTSPPAWSGKRRAPGSMFRVSMWSRMMSTRRSGTDSNRRPAEDFGVPSIGSPLSSRVMVEATVMVPLSMSILLDLRANTSPQRSPRDGLRGVETWLLLLGTLDRAGAIGRIYDLERVTERKVHPGQVDRVGFRATHVRHRPVKRCK